jgi:hypothetical protein
MSKNPIADKIAEEIANDTQRLKERYTDLWEFLDTTELSDSQKSKISDMVEGIVYYAERQSLQSNVQRINEVLSNRYWACSPSNPQPYYHHKHAKARATA